MSPQKKKEAVLVLAPPYTFPASTVSYCYLADFTAYISFPIPFRVGTLQVSL